MIFVRETNLDHPVVTISLFHPGAERGILSEFH